MATKLIGITALSLCLLLPSAARATTYYIDAVAGSDANAGRSRGGAWRTLAKAYSKINDAVIVGGDVILIRPGRYYVLDGPTGTSLGTLTWKIPGVAGQTRGGTAGHPITFSVDTNYSGNVEFTGSIPGNWNVAAGKTIDRNIAWTAVATECTGNGVPWSCCTGTGTGCSTLWYTTAPAPGGTSGTGAGVCFQPGTNPGDTPTMWEILYSADSVPVTMPTFTSGKNQCWFRPEYANFCAATNDPYACCTGAGVGATCLATVRVYAQTAAGTIPTDVEMPTAPAVTQFGITGVVQNLTFTNNNNGRKFFWRWGTTSVLHEHALNYATFEDFEIGYTSQVRAFTSGTRPAGTRSGSGFPRDTGGSAYLIREDESPVSGFAAVHHHNAYRRGTILRSQGDEAFHQAALPLVSGGGCTSLTDCTQTSNGTAVRCSSSICYYHDDTRTGFMTVEDVTFTDHPWEVPNGDTTTYGYAYSWPPAGYGAWATNYSSHFSPLGGGGQTSGAWIMQGQNNTLRRVTVQRVDGIVSFEASAQSWPSNNLVEDSTFDGAQKQYAGIGTSGPYPRCATCQCAAPTNCAGYGGAIFVRDDVGSWDIDVPGNVWRNNVFRNCYGGCYVSTVRAQGSGRSLAPQFVNNTMHTVVDLARSGHATAFEIGGKWGTVDSPGIVKNNIFVQDTAGVANVIWIQPLVTTTIVIDDNLYGPANMRWKWGHHSSTTTFATWKTNSGQDSRSPVPANPLFVNSPLDLHIALGSPARDTGVTVGGFSTDHDGVTRPQGTAWDIGAYEIRITSAPTLVSVVPTP